MAGAPSGPDGTHSVSRPEPAGIMWLLLASSHMEHGASC